MYLAPLNYDRFFKRVFSHTHIARAFLEDFLGVHIEEIELLPTENYLTEYSPKVIFDFRCKIEGKHIIIDMQQWYKKDVVKRFYLYHCASTVLQLELLKEKRLIGNKKDTRTKDSDYKQIVPVLTLVWMVTDRLDFDDNVVSFTTAPEELVSVMQDDSLWREDKRIELLHARQHLLKLLNNTHKEVNFLHQNRLIFMFQSNIVKETKRLEKYYRWFWFAEKTLNKENKADDFEPFKQDKVFKDIMQMIVKERLTDEDFDYMETEDETLEMHQRYLDGIREDIKEEVKGEVREEVREEIKEEVREEVLREEREKYLQEKQQLIKDLFAEGVSIANIAKFTKLTETEVQQILHQA